MGKWAAAFWESCWGSHKQLGVTQCRHEGSHGRPSATPSAAAPPTILAPSPGHLRTAVPSLLRSTDHLLASQGRGTNVPLPVPLHAYNAAQSLQLLPDPHLPAVVLRVEKPKGWMDTTTMSTVHDGIASFHTPDGHVAPHVVLFESGPRCKMVPVWSSPSANAQYSLQSVRDYQRTLKRLASRDPLLVYVLEKALRSLQPGKMGCSTAHVTADPCCVEPTLLGLRITACWWQEEPSSSMVEPAVIIQHGVGMASADVVPRVLRDYVFLNLIPCIVTVVTFAGNVLYQNASSLAYYGDFSWQPAQPDDSQLKMQPSGYGNIGDCSKLSATQHNEIPLPPLQQPAVSFSADTELIGTGASGSVAARQPDSLLTGPQVPDDKNLLKQLFHMDPKAMEEAMDVLSVCSQWSGVIQVPQNLKHHLRACRRAASMASRGAGQARYGPSAGAPSVSMDTTQLFGSRCSPGPHDAAETIASSTRISTPVLAQDRDTDSMSPAAHMYGKCSHSIEPYSGQHEGLLATQTSRHPHWHQSLGKAAHQPSMVIPGTHAAQHVKAEEAIPPITSTEAAMALRSQHNDNKAGGINVSLDSYEFDPVTLRPKSNGGNGRGGMASKMEPVQEDMEVDLDLAVEDEPVPRLQFHHLRAAYASHSPCEDDQSHSKPVTTGTDAAPPRWHRAASRSHAGHLPMAHDMPGSAMGQDALQPPARHFSQIASSSWLNFHDPAVPSCVSSTTHLHVPALDDRSFTLPKSVTAVLDVIQRKRISNMDALQAANSSFMYGACLGSPVASSPAAAAATRHALAGDLPHVGSQPLLRSEAADDSFDNQIPRVPLWGSRSSASHKSSFSGRLFQQSSDRVARPSDSFIDFRPASAPHVPPSSATAVVATSVQPGAGASRFGRSASIAACAADSSTPKSISTVAEHDGRCAVVHAETMGCDAHMGPCAPSPFIQGQPQISASGPLLSAPNASWMPPCWHEVTAFPMVDPVLDQRVLLITQTDVTKRVDVERKLAELTTAQMSMLEQMFPRHVIEHMLTEPGVLATDVGRLANDHDMVCVLFADVVGFTNMSKEISASEVMMFLNTLYGEFDSILEEFGLYQLDTMGDCYIVVGGLVERDEHGFQALRCERSPADAAKDAWNTMQFAKAMLARARQVCMPHNGNPVTLRVGIHSGRLVSGMLGTRLPKFTLFGDTMNTASRMESTSVPGCIQVSEAFYTLLHTSCDAPGHHAAAAAEDRGTWQATGGVEVKGKGVMNTWLYHPHACQHTLLARGKPAAVAGLQEAQALCRLPQQPHWVESSVQDPPAFPLLRSSRQTPSQHIPLCVGQSTSSSCRPAGVSAGGYGLAAGPGTSLGNSAMLAASVSAAASLVASSGHLRDDGERGEQPPPARNSHSAGRQCKRSHAPYQSWEAWKALEQGACGVSKTAMDRTSPQQQQRTSCGSGMPQAVTSANHDTTWLQALTLDPAAACSQQACSSSPQLASPTGRRNRHNLKQTMDSLSIAHKPAALMPLVHRTLPPLPSASDTDHYHCSGALPMVKERVGCRQAAAAGMLLSRSIDSNSSHRGQADAALSRHSMPISLGLCTTQTDHRHAANIYSAGKSLTGQQGDEDPAGSSMLPGYELASHTQMVRNGMSAPAAVLEGGRVHALHRNNGKLQSSRSCAPAAGAISHTASATRQPPTLFAAAYRRKSDTASCDAIATCFDSRAAAAPAMPAWSPPYTPAHAALHAGSDAGSLQPHTEGSLDECPDCFTLKQLTSCRTSLQCVQQLAIHGMRGSNRRSAGTVGSRSRTSAGDVPLKPRRRRQSSLVLLTQLGMALSHVPHGEMPDWPHHQVPVVKFMD